MNMEIFRFRVRTLSFLLCIALLSECISIAAVNPYEAITARNAFGIKPPAPPPPPEPPKVPAPKIKLQGMTTILGKKMVIFKAQLPAKPPEQPQPKEVSFMLSEGQREGEIEVLDINTETGAVRFQNYGVDQTLSMKEDADKPVALVSAPAPAAMPGAVPPPAPAAAPANAPGVAAPGATAIGGQRTIPTRNVRATGNEGAATGIGMSSTTASTVGTSVSAQRGVEANVALYEINRAKNEKLIESGIKLPRMPEHPLLKRARSDGDTQ